MPNILTPAAQVQNWRNQVPLVVDAVTGFVVVAQLVAAEDLGGVRFFL